MNESERVRVSGGYGNPYRIYINGKISTRYVIEKRHGWWYLIDEILGEEELLTPAGLFGGDEDDVKVSVIGKVAIREGLHASYSSLVEGQERENEEFRKETQKSLFFWMLLPILGVIGLISYCNYESPTEVAAKNEKGFHCLETWDGSHREFVQKVKARMNDPGSFEHVETRVGSKRGGRHSIYMTFRGKNVFGGTVQQVARGDFSNRSCAANIKSID